MGGGNEDVLNNFAFSLKVLAGVGSPGPWRVGLHSTFLDLVYLMAVKTSLPFPFSRNVCHCSSLAAQIVWK